MALYLGIDFGTSGARAVVIDGQGNIHAEVDCRFGAVRDDALADAWQGTLFDLIGQLPARLRSEVKAIAVDGTSSTTFLCNQAGNPLHPPLLYNDTRAVDEVETLKDVAPAGHVVLSAASSLAKLLWLSQQPQFSQAWYLMHQADWLAYLLHGQPGISDYHNSLKLGYDPAQACYPSWFMSATELQRVIPLLPKVLVPGTPIGELKPDVATHFGLAQDCLVCAGTTDSIAAFLASGATSPGEAVTSLGSTLALKLLSNERVEDSRYGIYSHRLGKLWLAGGASNAGGAVLRQFFTDTELKHLSGQIHADRESALQYYPLLKPGERFPLNNPQLQPYLQPRPESQVEFLHGLLESLARIEAQGYALLQQQGATPLTRVYSAGGGAKN
ncbi:MAG TPA: FGGY-family carbohydrate kinase, partial [Candidatus Caenarcaniphilales bacterium]